MKTKITPATIDTTIEQFKAQLLEENLNDAPALTMCYDNWFSSMAGYAKRNLETPGLTAKQAATFKAELEAWQRAHELFLTLAAPALHELAETIAQQIELEFSEHRVASADVAGNLRNLPLNEIMKHMN